VSFLKKNPLFSVVVALSLLVFLAGAILALQSAGKTAKAERAFSSAESRLAALRSAAPTPNEVNVAAAEENLEALTSVVANIRGDLQQGSELTTTEDGVSVIAGIQQYIATFQKMTANRKNEAGEPSAIEIPEDFSFGFRRYSRDVTPPSDPRIAALLDKQRQILTYLLEQLIEAGPQGINAVHREAVDGAAADNKFSISPSISARVPGAIETMGFRLTFTGYTDSLRDFLNNLNEFELPIVVRSIEVERPSGSETVVATAQARDGGGIFELFGGGDTTTDEVDNEWPKPVIVDNVSTFTVTVEFIELVLPDAENLEDSNPA